VVRWLGQCGGECREHVARRGKPHAPNLALINRNMFQYRFLDFFKRNRILLAFVLSGALWIFQVRLVASAFLMNLEQIQVTRMLVQSDVYRGAECGVPGMPGASRALLARADTWNPNDPRMNYRWGTLDWLEGKCDSALAYWQASANAQDSESVWASLALARGLLHVRMREPAIEILRQAGLEYYLYQLGYSREIAGDALAAIDFYSLALDVRPTYTSANGLARVYAGQGNIQAERELWQKMIAANPTGSLLHFVATAELAAQDGDWDTLFDAYTRAAQASEDEQTRFDLYLSAARALEAGKQTDRAILAYERAIAISPKSSSEPYTALARIRAAQGNNAAARELFDRAIFLFPRDPWVYISAGNFEGALNHVAEARGLYSTALQVAPNHVGALWMWGEFEYKQGNIQTAIDYLERANVPVPICDVSKSLKQIYQAIGDEARYQSLERTLAGGCR